MTSTTLQISMPMLGAAAAAFCLFNPMAVLSVLWEWFLCLAATAASIASLNLIGLRLNARTILALLIDHRYFFTLLSTAVCATVLQPYEHLVPEYHHHASFALDWTLPLVFRAVLCGGVILARVVLSASHERRGILLKIRIATLWLLPAVGGVGFLLWLEGRRAALRDLFRSGTGVLSVSDDAKYEPLSVAHHTILCAVAISTYSLMLELAKPALLVVATVMRSGWEEARQGGGSAYWHMDTQVALDLAVASVDLLVAIQHGPLSDWRGVPLPWLVQTMTLYRLYHVFVRWSVYAGFRSLLHSFPERIDLEDAEVGCLICRDALKRGESVRALPCGHAFHSRCIHHWLATSPVCPLCRTDPWKTLLDRRRRQHENEGIVEEDSDDNVGASGPIVSAATSGRRTEAPAEGQATAARAPTHLPSSSLLAASLASARRSSAGAARGPAAVPTDSWESMPHSHHGISTEAATAATTASPAARRSRHSTAGIADAVEVSDDLHLAQWMVIAAATAAATAADGSAQARGGGRRIPSAPGSLLHPAPSLVHATGHNPPSLPSDNGAGMPSEAPELPAAKKRRRGPARRTGVTTVAATIPSSEESDEDRLPPPVRKRRTETGRRGPRRR